MQIKQNIDVGLYKIVKQPTGLPVRLLPAHRAGTAILGGSQKMNGLQLKPHMTIWDIKYLASFALLQTDNVAAWQKILLAHTGANGQALHVSDGPAALAGRGGMGVICHSG